ncbi:MAG: phosphate/phosphite/phosphonate ABC transporter substrate-binding protein, partial [Nitrospirae bacterium]|nr:phosphate/phosphite/phosphonate ABC transporter substrate-binding protein [Nitrospirota bacterium]
MNTRTKMVIGYIPIFLCIFLLFSGCSREKATEVSLEKTTAEPKPAEEKGLLKIAVSGIVSPKKTFIYYKEMFDYISKKAGIPVELIQRDTYAEVNDLIRDDKIAAAFVCSGAYVDGRRDFGMELLAAPLAYGEMYYYSYIIVPKESNAKSLEDLRGKRFAFSDPMSNSGKTAPTYMLARMGEKPETFFSETIFTYSHDKSIEAVALHLVDGAAVDSLIWQYDDDTAPRFTSKTKVIVKSEPFGIPPVV